MLEMRAWDHLRIQFGLKCRVFDTRLALVQEGTAQCWRFVYEITSGPV
jgi:hypothetical protein